MFATSILAPIASGLLTTVDLDKNIAEIAALLGFLGFGVGIGFQGPQVAIQAVLSPQDVSIGAAIVGFGGGMGSALWTCASATLFQNHLVADVEKFSPATNGTALENIGLSDLRHVIGSERLKDVLSGYNEAVVQTLYLPLALSLLTAIGTIAMERRSLKEKRS